MPGLSFTYAIVTPIPFLQNGYALGEYLTGEADGLLLVLGLYGGKQPAVQARRFLHVPRLNAVMLFYERRITGSNARKNMLYMPLPEAWVSR